MSKPTVDIKVTADGVGFNRTMNQIESRLKGFSSAAGRGNLGGMFGSLTGGVSGLGLSGGMAAVIGASAAAVVALAALANNTMNYGHEMADLAENFGITTDEAQKLSFAAELAGKDMGFVEGMLNKIDMFAEKALVNGSDESRIAGKLGLSQSDLSTMNNARLLEEISRRAKDVNLSQTDLVKVAGKGGGRTLLEMGGKLETAEKYGMPLTPRAIAMLDEEWENLKIAVHWVTDALKIFGTELVSYWRILRSPSAWKHLFTGNWKALSQDYDYARGIGVPTKEKVEVNRNAPTTDSKPLGEMGGNNPFLKIGGLMGVDTNYRIERLLSLIEYNTRKEQQVIPASPPVTSPFAMYIPQAANPSPRMGVAASVPLVDAAVATVRPNPPARAEAAKKGFPTGTFGM